MTLENDSLLRLALQCFRSRALSQTLTFLLLTNDVKVTKDSLGYTVLTNVGAEYWFATARRWNMDC